MRDLKLDYARGPSRRKPAPLSWAAALVLTLSSFAVFLYFFVWAKSGQTDLAEWPAVTFPLACPGTAVGAVVALTGILTRRGERGLWFLFVTSATGFAALSFWWAYHMLQVFRGS
jgi:hypothetical protein